MSSHSTAERRDTALELFRELQDHIQNADQKVQFILTANAFLAAGISLETRHALDLIKSAGLTASSTMTLVLIGMLLLGIVASTVFAVLTLVPRMVADKTRSALFFADIASQSVDAFVKEITELTDEQIVHNLLIQVHSNARVAREKFRWARYSTLTLAICLIFWVIIQLIGFLF